MKTKWLAIIPFVALAVVACSDTQPPVTETVTETAPQPTSETAAQPPQPTTPAETTTQQAEGINQKVRTAGRRKRLFKKISQKNIPPAGL